MKTFKPTQKSIAIIGGGPSAMLLAAHLNPALYDVTIFERNATLGRKFLVAGKGGFNLTHGEDIDMMKTRYRPQGALDNALDAFDNISLRKWFERLGIATFEGTSHRIFPTKGIKPIEVLNGILKDLKSKAVTLKTNHIWRGLDPQNQLIFENNEGQQILVKTDIVVFALGGKSWQKTGSRGEWYDWMMQKGVKMVPFEAANCGFGVNWPSDFIKFHEGKPLKNIAVKMEDKILKGELMITSFGLEGSPIYAASGVLKKSLKKGSNKVLIDLKPTLTKEKVTHKLNNFNGKSSWTQHMKSELKMSSTQLSLLKNYTDKTTFHSPPMLAEALKNLSIEITHLAPIDEAISTTGGISIEAIGKDFQLNNLPNHYAIGEMLDWDAPTGGYLLQACMSMGVYLAKRLNAL